MGWGFLGVQGSVFWGSQPHQCPPLNPHSPPTPAELGEVLGELRRLEMRLEPFRQRYRDILSSAATADYSNDVRGDLGGL